MSRHELITFQYIEPVDKEDRNIICRFYIKILKEILNKSLPASHINNKEKFVYEKGDIKLKRQFTYQKELTTITITDTLQNILIYFENRLPKKNKIFYFEEDNYTEIILEKCDMKKIL